MIVDIPGNSSIELDVLPLKSLKPHEEVIPELLESVTRDMERAGEQRDPVLVDRDSRVVLDGMHRRAALAALGMKHVVCAIYDYMSHDVILQRWLRYFVARDRKMLGWMKSFFGFEKIQDLNLAIDRVDAGRSSVAMLSKEDSYISSSSLGMDELYDKIKHFDEHARNSRMELQFVSESELTEVFASRSAYLVYPRPLTKLDVLGKAERGSLLPCKTTRHIMPVRPMRLQMPLSVLNSSKATEPTIELRRIVAHTEPELIQTDVFYEGRRYREPLAVFRRRSIPKSG